ncbi:MAG: Ldh family oxidoreductase [Halobacteriota archaeon]
MTRVPLDTLDDVARSLLGVLPLAGEDVEAVATSLIEANRRGHDSHGVSRIPQYVQMVEEGVIDPGATPSVERDNGLTAIVDGQLAFGQLVGRDAVDVLTTNADENGVSVVGVRDATHLGRIGEWAERATDRGLLFMAFVSSQGMSPVVAPAGSAHGRLSTNPVCFGVPTFGALDFPIVLDMATSQVANGKIRNRQLSGDPLPEGWAVTDDGDSVRDPDQLQLGQRDAAILPLGGTVSGYKGFGLSVMTALFSSILSDGLVAGQREDVAWFNNVAAFVAVDPLQFTTREALVDRVATLAAYLRDTEYSEHVSVGDGAKGDETLLPGESEHRTLLDRTERGVPIPARICESLVAFGRDHGVELDLPVE